MADSCLGEAVVVACFGQKRPRVAKQWNHLQQPAAQLVGIAVSTGHLHCIGMQAQLSIMCKSVTCRSKRERG